MEIGRKTKKKRNNRKKVKRPIKYNDPKLNVDVDEQHDDIKHLKEHLNIWTCNPLIATYPRNQENPFWNYCGQMLE